MKIYLYKKWLDTPDHPQRSYKTIGSAFLQLSTQTMSSPKIIGRMHSFVRSNDIKTHFLVVVKDTNYENALEGTPKQIYDFVRDVLSDEGYMSKKWGNIK